MITTHRAEDLRTVASNHNEELALQELGELHVFERLLAVAREGEHSLLLAGQTLSIVSIRYLVSLGYDVYHTGQGMAIDFAP